MGDLPSDRKDYIFIGFSRICKGLFKKVRKKMSKKLVQFFYFVAVHTGNKVLEVINFYTHDRASLGIRNLKPGAANQMWAFVPCGGGFYEIINKHSNMVLDDSTFSRPGGVVYQYHRHGGANQHWRVKKAGEEDYIQFFSKCGNLVLDVGDQRKDDGAVICVWHDWKGSNQTWRLIRA